MSQPFWLPRCGGLEFGSPRQGSACAGTAGMSFRLDRFATLYVFSQVRRQASGSQPPVPVLMYHSISDDEETGLHPYYRTATSPQRFAAHLQHLHAEGYRTASLSEIAGQLQGQGQGQGRGQTAATAKGKSVVITFDDGYRDFYRHAFPVLNQHGFRATVFLPTAYIGESPVCFKGKECLTWAEVRELHHHGITFGSHTVTHPQLRELSARAIQQEIADSRQTIEERLGCVVDSFAYPYAFPQTDSNFKTMLRDFLATAGYKNGVCTMVGRVKRTSDPLFMERLPVNSGDDAALFAAKLGGAYDWMGKSQHLSKMIRTWLRGSVGRAKYNSSKDFPWSSREFK
jgi:peptidoglycan/xylan/chitin deacetylase (PgdA/CDA1 family)